MPNKTILKIIAPILLILGFLSYAKFSQAITITPLRLELSANPGDTVGSNFKIYNDTDKQQNYYFLTSNFEAKDESGEPTFTSQTGGLADWIQKPQSISVSARSHQVVDFLISVPKDAEAGGYFAGLLTSIKPPEIDGQSSKVSLSSQVGVLILFRVNGNVPEGANVLEYDTQNHKHFYTSLPVEFYYRFQNGGGDRLKPLGDIIISNTFGSTTKIIRANYDGGNVLPKSIRRFKAGWYEAGDPKEQDPKILSTPVQPKGFWKNVAYEFNHFAFGRYTAKLTLVFGHDTQTSVIKKTSFWIFPWQLLLVAIISIFIFLAGLIGVAVWIVYKIIRWRDNRPQIRK